MTAGLLGAAALAEHAVALAAFRNTCGLAEDGVEQFQQGDGQDPQMQVREVVEIGAFAVLCTVSIGPAITLRAVVPVFLGGSLAVAAGGGHLRGTYLGYRDTFVRPRARKEKVLLGVGGALVALGGTVWLGSRLSMLRNRVGCDSITCLAGYDFATLHLSAALSISGAATLGLGLAYRTSRRRFLRLEELHVVPIAGRGSGGMALSGRF
ncbi:MAG: hypothetical protein D6705_02150 [Deltaproteobacteria bacterium]|nr:MAG: hypothetical protein D6705_02150 [Deltaproteobacteria bacterium]